jgi:hypothetical protein
LRLLVADLDLDHLALQGVAGEAVDELAADLGLIVADQPHAIERQPGLRADLDLVRLCRGAVCQHTEEEERAAPHGFVIARRRAAFGARVVVVGDVGYA